MRLKILFGFLAIFLFLPQIVLAADFQVRGKVIDNQNNPIVNGEVIFADKDGKTVVNAFTNMNGTYLLSVPIGTYTVLVKGPLGSNLPQSSTVGQIISGDTVRDFTIATNFQGETKKIPGKPQIDTNTIIIYVLAGVLVLLALAIFYTYWRTNRKSKPPEEQFISSA